MWNNRTLQRSVVFVALAIGAPSGGSARVVQIRQDVSGGNGADLVQAKCLSCHQMDMIQQQRLTRSGWQREVDKMIRWGASVSDSDRDLLADYLAATLPAVSVQSASEDDTRSAEIFRRHCLSCHQADTVEQQRLGAAAWRREIDKMIAWGADVASTDRDNLVRYLSAHFGPR